MTTIGRGFGCSALIAVLLAGWIVGSGIMWLVKPIQNGCDMTYMYPTYIPITNVTLNRYALYLYHEGWKKFDYDLHLLKLSGVPVLFIPGNGGSYKQVRSLAAESERSYNGGPMDEGYFKKAGLTSPDHDRNWKDIKKDLVYTAQEQYANKLDWFSVDLEGEHSAMDGRILEEHTDCVVQAINRILDRYRESLEARSQQTKEAGDFLPRSVILVGHSMGGFIARAAVVHPRLKKGAVETIVTLASPHSVAPLPLQPFLGHFYSRVNDVWRKGYKAPRMRTGRPMRGIDPVLSRVVVVSIFGGTQDYQVRSRFASLDDIVPPTHGLTVGAPGMLNVWLSMEHQSILWCNQLVVQVADTLLQLVDKRTGQPFERPDVRLAVFVTKLRSALPEAFGWLPSLHLKRAPMLLEKVKNRDNNEAGTKEERQRLALEDIDFLTKESAVDSSQEDNSSDLYACPRSTHWIDERKEKDLYIDIPTVTVLAMDGKRRWLDIQRMTSNEKNWFTLVTNLAPCTGITVHLWPEKPKSRQEEKLGAQGVIEVTMKIAKLPTGPSHAQIEPGGQSEQPSPSGVLQLNPHDLQGYRFLTVSVAPHPSMSGRPPSVASMAVGQFFNPKDGKDMFSARCFISSTFKKQDLVLKENHPLVADITMGVSLGTLPMGLEIRTRSCGSTDSVLAKQKPSGTELTRLCKLRCFPPVVLVWDPNSGLQVFPNFYHETITVDSSPVLWGSKTGSGTTVLLLVDPHCEYHVSIKVSLFAAASRFLLMHLLQVVAIAVAVLFFAMMRQARAWELDAPLPSSFACIEGNLMIPFPFLTLSLGPVVIYAFWTVLGTHVLPALLSFLLVSSVCYILANGIVAVLAVSSMGIFYAAASIQIFLKLRWQSWEDHCHVRGLRWVLTCMSGISTLQVVRTVRSKPTLTVAVVATVLIFFVHPGLGLTVLLLAHAWRCHGALCSHRQQLAACRTARKDSPPARRNGGWRVSLVNGDDSSEVSGINFAESQLEVFHQHQSLLLLHLTATLMFMPSLVAWIQRSGMDRSLPGFWDSLLSFGLVLHGLYSSNTDGNLALFSRFRSSGPLFEYAGLSFIYGIAGIYCYISGLVLAPYRVFHAMALIGYLTTISRLLETWTRGKGELGVRRRYYHRHD